MISNSTKQYTVITNERVMAFGPLIFFNTKRPERPKQSNFNPKSYLNIEVIIEAMNKNNLLVFWRKVLYISHLSSSQNIICLLLIITLNLFLNFKLIFFKKKKRL